jgi:exosome complex RNA-binding protein Rrp42 (RNase PH superfamily)
MPHFNFFVNRNLVDAANIAALASLLTFRRPECSLGGEDGQQVVVHPPEVSFLSLPVCSFAPVFYSI